MNELTSMIWVETRKALRSRMPLYTAAGALLMPLGFGLLVLIAATPGLTDKLGLVGAKSNLAAYAATDWPAYLVLTSELLSAGGFFIFCLATAWVYGREFVDGTVKDLLAVPVHRGSILLAKYLVASVWSVAIALLILAASMMMGAIIHLPHATAPALLIGAGRAVVTTLLLMVVITPFAWLAGVGRGYLLPIGCMVLAVIAANLLAVAGVGGYFPWAVPGLYAQAQGYLVPASIPIALATGVAGAVATYLWWKYADQTR